MRDYGKSLPWPASSYAVRPCTGMLHAIFDRWRAFKILSHFSRQEWPQLRLKVSLSSLDPYCMCARWCFVLMFAVARWQISAASALKGRRPYWGSQRNWLGDYLSLSTENPDFEKYTAAVRSLQREDKFPKVRVADNGCIDVRVVDEFHTWYSQVMFSSFVKKTNKFNKCADRVLLVSEYCIYKLDATKFKSMKKALPIEDVSSETITMHISIYCTCVEINSYSIYVFRSPDSASVRDAIN
jgi:myosin-1